MGALSADQENKVNERYSRQILFREIGKAGQEKLLNSRVLLVGCGALGASHAEMLARAGTGNLRIVDRDFVEFTNLQRQTLYSEQDARDRLPKAIAAKNRIAAINSETKGRGDNRRCKSFQYRGSSERSRPRHRRHGQFPGPLPGKRRLRKTRDSMDLRRGRFFLWRNHDHNSRRNALPALHIRGDARRRQLAHLRHRRRDHADHFERFGGPGQ